MSSNETGIENPFLSPQMPPVPDVPAAKSSPFAWVFRGAAAVIILVLLLLLLMPVHRGRQPALRTQCKNNLKQIGLALYNYHDDYGCFPPAWTTDAGGKRLHSWRTLLLPYLEQQALYSRIDLSQPWNAPVHHELTEFETAPNVCRCPSSDLPTGHTNYLGLNDTGCFFNGTVTRSIADIKDGTSNTLAVIEVPSDHTVHWMSPQDADETLLLSISNSDSLSHQGGIQVLVADGSVRFLSATTDVAVRRRIASIAVDDTVGEW